MSNNDDEDIEIIMNKKSRFSRYRARLREKKQFDTIDVMTTDNLSNISENETCDFVENMIIDSDYNPMSGAILNEAAKPDPSERHDDGDNNYGNEPEAIGGEDEIDSEGENENESESEDVGENESESESEDVGENESESESEDGSEKEIMEEISEAETEFSDDQIKKERLPNATELSVMLFVTFKRHAISKAAANDICRIINMFNVPNMPKDFRGVMSHLKRNNPTLLEENRYSICPSCGGKFESGSKCGLAKCQASTSTVRTPTSVSVFSLAPQICSILEREALVKPLYKSNECDDLLNSRYSQEIAAKEKQINLRRNYITLTLCNDGVLVKRISRPIWVTCACINELPRSKRYDINNILLCSISTGDEKPKKDDYSIILQDIVNELKILEEFGFDVLLPSTTTNRDRTYTHLYAYTISAVCDKPAQALMMNIKDPTGFFSCAWCCIAGETHAQNSRCFVTNTRTPATSRNNITYDYFMKILESNYVAKDPSKDKACGHAGRCALRQLKYFEIGESFCYDSLHGLYSGVFKKLMHLWLDTVRSDYSIKKQFSHLEKLLQNIHYPTTNRLPRALRYYTTWKGNEFRMTLLFGYKVFEQLLKKKYYDHFRLLAYAAIYSETRTITTTRSNQIKSLLDKFLDEFHLLYAVSNCVSIVHTLSHVHQSIVKFGPIHNYSTFNFESTVGSFVKLVHGPSFLLKQLVNNFELISHATTVLKTPNFHRDIALLIHQILSSKRRAVPTTVRTDTHISLTRPTTPAFSYVTEYLDNMYGKDKYRHYSLCFYQNTPFNIHYSTTKQVDNSAVIYSDHLNNLHIGMIIGIIQLQANNEVMFIIEKHDIIGFDSFSIDQTQYMNDFLVYAKHSDPPNIVSINYKSIQEKIGYRRNTQKNKISEFLIFPNLMEST